MTDNINVDTMIAKQNKRLLEIDGEEAERAVYDDTCYHNVAKVVTFTRMASHKGNVLLFRYIGGKVVRVVFNYDVQVVDILDYIELPDDAFIRCAERVPIMD